jgi:hypothetical protein
MERRKSAQQATHDRFLRKRPKLDSSASQASASNDPYVFILCFIYSLFIFVSININARVCFCNVYLLKLRV